MPRRRLERADAVLLLVLLVQLVVWLGLTHLYARFAVVLLIPIGGTVAAWAVWQGYVPAWYAAVLAGLGVWGLIHTVRDGNRMSPIIRAVYSFGFRLSERLPKGV